MKLTREEAIIEFRKMWNWIADETERRNRVVSKEDYFVENDVEDVQNDCFLCEYDLHCGSEYVACECCPIDFGETDEHDEYGIRDCPCLDIVESPYNKWSNWKSWCTLNKGNDHFEGYYDLAQYAREVANLPEKEV